MIGTVLQSVHMSFLCEEGFMFYVCLWRNDGPVLRLFLLGITKLLIFLKRHFRNSIIYLAFKNVCLGYNLKILWSLSGAAKLQFC